MAPRGRPPLLTSASPQLGDRRLDPRRNHSVNARDRASPLYVETASVPDVSAARAELQEYATGAVTEIPITHDCLIAVMPISHQIFLLLLLTVLAWTSPCFGQSLIEHRDGCCGTTDVEQLGDVCTYVGSQLHEETSNSPNRYVYQTAFQGAAGASVDRDSPELVRKKIQHFWHKHHTQIRCVSSHFNISGGSLIKFAVSKGFEAFIRDVVQTWALPLNYVDPADGRTILDYIEDEGRKYPGLREEFAKHQRYFQKAGAKRKAELSNGSANDQQDPHDEVRPLLAIWEHACYFSEGLAAVKAKGKWGFVDRQHRIKVEPSYDGAFGFSQGRAAVRNNGKWGYIDASGAVVIPLKYADAHVFINGSARVTLDGREWVTIDLDGNPR
jgi:hypothetical protein